jgi:predicted nucleotidyltransferase
MGRSGLSPLVDDVLDRFARGLREKFGPRLLGMRVFGSYTRGEAHEMSDLDVFVLLDTVSWADQTEILNLAGDLWSESELFVSPVIMDQARFEKWRRQERPLVMQIEAEGIPL